MNCREVEKLIYLYAEVAADKREAVDRHTHTCVACTQLLEAVKAQRRMITAASRAVPQLPDASQMTHRILEAVHQKRYNKKSLFNIHLKIAPLNVLRYSMAMISFLLVATFAAEYNTDAKRIQPYPTMQAEDNTVLNSTAFHAAFMENRRTENSNRARFYECLMNCLYTSDGNCQECKKQIAKLN